MHKQSAEIDWKQLAEQRKTVNVQRETEIERLHSRLVALERGVHELADRLDEPEHDLLSGADLRALLNPSVSHETEETP